MAFDESPIGEVLIKANLGQCRDFFVIRGSSALVDLILFKHPVLEPNVLLCFGHMAAPITEAGACIRVGGAFIRSEQSCDRHDSHLLHVDSV